jgi:hypothetical protein
MDWELGDAPLLGTVPCVGSGELTVAIVFGQVAGS